MPFEPIAIVGRGCVLPDAADPDRFWENIASGRSSVGPVPTGRWRLDPASVLGGPDSGPDRVFTDRGGYVRDLDVLQILQNANLSVDGGLEGLDAQVLWILYAASAALREAGQDGLRSRAGLILGNLSYPTVGLSAYAEHVWGRSAEGEAGARGIVADARNRFMSGFPVHLASRALGLGGGGFALDAACASSLYAIKLACDRLHDRSADLMLAGAVNCPDDLFIHMGFSALSALSPSGRSRPFHAGADGLVPGEGAAVLTLMRLEDAVKAGARIFGVIRAVGLSNDGRSRGVLVPSQEGQVRAMLDAYRLAGVDPGTVTLAECHATGTSVGDQIEVRSTAEVFAGHLGLPIGSVKSNIGHLITAAGTTGLLKVLGAMNAGVRPASLHADEPLEMLRDTPLRLLREAEDWTGPRRASVSAFGFGGNNAHLIVDAWTADGTGCPAMPSPNIGAAASERGEPEAGELEAGKPVAVVGVGALVADGEEAADLCRAMFAGMPVPKRRSHVAVGLDGTRFPPRDLEETLPQQLLLMEAAREAIGNTTLPRDRTTVLIGMGCDPEIARYGARWRTSDDEAFIGPLSAAGVLGRMPNLVTNRLNSQFDLAGPSYSVSAEQASGVVALQLGVRALQAGEADAALVGAVDLSAEPVHTAALREIGETSEAGDAAVVLALKRLADARRDGDRVFAVLAEPPAGDAPAETGLLVGDSALIEAARTAADNQPDDLDRFDPAALFGRAHAASGLLAVAVAALALYHRSAPAVGRPATPMLGTSAAETMVCTLGGDATRVRLVGATDTCGFVAEPMPRLHVYSGADRAEVLVALAENRESADGPARLVLLVEHTEELAVRAAAAKDWLTGAGHAPDGAYFRETPLRGEIGFVFSGGSMAYPGMGRDLMLAFPREMDRLAEICGPYRDLVRWAYDGSGQLPEHVLEQIWGASLLGNLHARITRNLLGVQPQAVLGYSAGESAALSAMGVWTDPAGLVADARRSDLFGDLLAGEFTVARAAWRELGIPDGSWASYVVNVSAQRMRDAIAGEPAVHLMVVNAPDSCVFGGEASGCARVLKRLPDAVALPVPYDVSVHVPEIEAIRGEWRQLHHRPTSTPPGLRFYSAATGTWYLPTADSAADAVTDQALGEIDFARVVEAAWADGVRVFIEHGPRNLCAGWIGATLGAEREHLAVSVDASDSHGLRRVVRVAAQLVSVGVDVDVAALHRHLDHLEASHAPLTPPRHVLNIPAHAPAVSAHTPTAPVNAEVSEEAVETATRGETQTEAQIEVMAPAPELSPDKAATNCAQQVAVDEGSAPAVSRPAVPQAAALVVSALHRQQRLVAEAHRRFLAVQAQAQRQFLDARSFGSRLMPLPPTAAVALPRAERTPPAALPLPPVALPPAAPAPAPPVTVPQPAPDKSPAPQLPDTEPHVELPGPKFGRAELEQLASGRISELFGPLFAAQDDRVRQTRMPEPPLLLTDRVTGIDAEPGSMGIGTIWTETDVALDGWYLDGAGRMLPGLTVEAGQADLLLISWLGADLAHAGDRVYRLLGSELTYHGPLPRPGERLDYEIHIDGHAEADGKRLFFFHYDCTVDGELRLTVRNGQAGFFTDEELAGTGGILWDPAEHAPAPDVPLDAPEAHTPHRAFDADAVSAFAEGRTADCFGEAFDRARTHVRTPRIPDGRLQLLDEVTDFDPAGGPWGRGYLRARTAVRPSDWFFDGHFKNDPCMPGTLMLDGAFQAMSFYLTGLGYTIDRDGWRFEPVAGAPYPMVCRGQCTPQSRELTYEVFVSEISAGPEPTVFADVLVTVDGVKAFHTKRLGLRLVPDWPLDHWRQLAPHQEQTSTAFVPVATLGGLVGYQDPGPVAEYQGFKYDYASLLAGAWGNPRDSFGPPYKPFADGLRRAARLPGPPYHFVSRISSVSGPPLGMEPGITISAEYDVPQKVWYFDEGDGAMPFGVLMEVVLQPCGWLSSYVGSALTTDEDLLYRNLDGNCTVHRDVTPDIGTVTTTVTMRNSVQNSGVIIQTFEVHATAGGEPILDLTTVFGFFPVSAFDNQVGLVPSPEELTAFQAPSGFAVDLRDRSARYFAGPLALPSRMLLMLDRVTGYWPEGGSAGLGRLRAEKDITADEWFFKAHFYQDPVQPGSLGVQAMVQLLHFYLLERGLGAGIPNPRVQPILTGEQLSWKYRGQVVPTNDLVAVEVEITEVGEDGQGVFVFADTALWVDGKRIYTAKHLGLRIMPGDESDGVDSAESAEEAAEPHVTDEVLDPDAERWIQDHRPTFTVPALPMASIVDRLADAAHRFTGQPVRSVRDVTLRRWIPVAEPVRLRTQAAPAQDADDGAVSVTLSMWREAGNPALSRYEPVATAIVYTDAPHHGSDSRLPIPAALEAAPDPYRAGTLFHGPAFQYLVDLRTGSAEAAAVLDAARGTVPHGYLNQGLLDALTHVIPHDRLHQWSVDIPPGLIGYPHRIERLDLHAPLPHSGLVQARARFTGFHAGNRRLPAFHIELWDGEHLIAALDLVEVLLPGGSLGSAAPAQRRAFLRDRQYCDGLGLSATAVDEGSGDAVTRLTESDVATVDWLPGTVAEIYNLPPDARGTDRLVQIAVRDHVARRAHVHPSRIVVAEDGSGGHPEGHPEGYHAVQVQVLDSEVVVRGR